MIYTIPEDLSGNIGDISTIEFQTKELDPPVSFSLKSTKILNEENLLKTLSLITGELDEIFEITGGPDIEYYDSLDENGKKAFEE